MPTRASYNFSRPRHWQTERPDPARPPDSRLHASTPSWRQPRPASRVAPASLRAGFGALGPADGAGRPGGGADAHGARNAPPPRPPNPRGRPLPPAAEAAVAGPNKARPPPAGGAVPPAQAQPGPGWETLDTAQKLALYPLAERWSLISQAQKRRWLTLAANYPHLSQEEQRKFLERITAWANLSAQQRSQARLNYAVTTGLARADKRAQWEAYQALSDEQRRALAARAAPKPR